MKTMTRTFKRNRRTVLASIIAALFALITLAGFSLVNPNLSASADTYTYLALGDSITTGYGLSDPDTEGFVPLLATSLNKTALNKGVDGQTTTELIASVSTSSDATTLAALQTSEVITITIGSNDLMEVFYEFVGTKTGYSATDVQNALTYPTTYYTAAQAIILNLTMNDYTADLAGDTDFADAIDATVANINTITSAIRTINSSAVILVANQYNPYAWISISNIINLFETGVTLYNTDLANDSNGEYEIVDVYSAFAASGTALTNVDINSYDFDYHPNADGHAVIASAMASAYSAAASSGTTTAADMAIRLGADTITTGNTLYLGTYGSYNVPWIVLDDNGTLLSEYILDGSEYCTYNTFYTNGNTTFYYNSDLENTISSLYSSILTSVEQNQINDTQITDNGTLSAKFYALSSAEASALSDDVRIAYYIDDTSTAGAWWTRTIESVGFSADGSFAYIIYTDGNIFAPPMNGLYGVRPATSLNTANVLFTSAAADGKEASGMDGGLTAVESYGSGTDWKATLYDDSRSGFTASRTSKNGNVITIDYSGAATGTDEYISAIVVDESGAVTQYGRILQLDGTTNAASGTFTLDISSLASTDTLYIINEQYNGSYATDYSSALTAIDTAKSNSELTAEIAELEAELTQAIADLTNSDAALTTRIDALETIATNAATLINRLNNEIANLDSTYATDSELAANLSSLQTTLEAADAALQTAIDQVQTNLDAAISNLTTAINNGDSDLSDKIDTLEAAYLDADSILSGNISTLQGDLNALESTMNTADAALQTAIDQVQTNLDAAISNLTTAINNGDSDLSDKITAVDDAYKAADLLINSDISVLQTKDGELEASITALTSTMNTADDALQTAIDQVQTNLDAAISNLTTAINNGDSDLSDKITAVDDAYKAADLLINSDISALQTKDGELEASITALTSTMNTADDALQTAIDQVQTNLNNAVADLEKAIADGDSDLSDEIDALNAALADVQAAIDALDNTYATDSETAAQVSELKMLINSSQASTLNVVQQKLDDAVADLNAAIASGDDDLSDEIAAVEAAYKAADTLLNGELSDLETTFTAADEALQAAIDSLQQQLSDTKAELEAMITETKDNADTQQTISIVMYSILGVLSLGGVGMSAGLWISLRKRK